MRVAQVAPLYETVPPTGYGGTERVIAALTDELQRSGHDVTLFAADESTTSARLEPMAPSPLRTRMTRAEIMDVAPHLHLQMLSQVYQRADEFDIIHSHVDIWTLPFAAAASTPTLLTMHGRLDLDVVQSIVGLYPDVPLVSISEDQRIPLRGRNVRWAGTVPNGLDLSMYLSTPRGRGDYLAFVGRVSPEKGPLKAVEVAWRTGWNLGVAAKIDPLDMDYYRDRVERWFLSDGVNFIGEIEERSKPAFYAGAAATLFPSDWPEPFGLVMIESMAAGTPVIALRRGSVPEVIVDGVTGFICDDVDAMVKAVGRIGEIDPRACRCHAATFNGSAMAAAYTRIYHQLARSTPRRSVHQKIVDTTWSTVPATP